MKTTNAALKVGVTFLVVGIAGYWAFSKLAKGKWATEDKPYLLHAYFHDATLLVEKSRVQVSGVSVGHIIGTVLEVDPPRPELRDARRFAKVVIGLNPGVKLYSNAIVAKTSASLLGDFYLEIFPGTAQVIDAGGRILQNEVLEDGDEIVNVRELTTTSEVMNQIATLTPSIKGLADDLRAFTNGPLTDLSHNINDGISENREAIHGMLLNMEAITEQIRNMTGAAQDDVAEIVTNMREISSSVRALIGKSGETTEDGKTVADSVVKLNRSIDKLDSSLGNIEGITSDLQEGKGTVGRLFKDEKLINSVEQVVDDAGSIVRTITGMQTTVGLRTEYNFESGGIKTYLTVEFQPRLDKYYLIELVDDPRGKRSVSTIVTRSDDPNKPLITREERIEVSDAFRFTFMFAKRLGFATFRFGVKESTGGVGMDLAFFRRRLQLWTDFFDFQADVFPRWKSLLAWEFFSHVYAIGGIDDVLNDRPADGIGGGRDYFMGAQLRFSDDDLRNMLLFGLGGAAASGAR